MKQFNYQWIKKLSLLICLVFWSSCLSKQIIHSTPSRCQYGKPYQIKNKWYYPMTYIDYFEQKGIASWYGKKFHGRKTSNGETYDMYGISAAHKTLPLGTVVRVYNLDNKRCMTVRINDRGPFIEGRIIDLSYAAAKKMGFAQKGTANVYIQTVKCPEPKQKSKPLKAKKHQKALPKQMVSRNCFQIQVGAFSDRRNAASLCNRLKPLFKDSHISKSQSKSKTLYRVLIGNCMPQQKAVYVERQLGHHGFQDAFVVAQVK